MEPLLEIEGTILANTTDTPRNPRGRRPRASNPPAGSVDTPQAVPPSQDPSPALELRVATPAPIMTPMDLLSKAMDQGAGLDLIEKLMDLRDRDTAFHARAAFIQAMADFKADPPTVLRDKENLQYKSKYVSLGALVHAVTPALSRHGFSFTWKVDQTPQNVTVTCVLSHALGHSEAATMTAPADKSGAKNGIQEIKSTITYCKATTLESVLGIASTDANLDDDGNGFGVTESVFQGHMAALRGAKDVPALQAAWERASTDSKKDRTTLTALARAKDERKAELRGAK